MAKVTPDVQEIERLRLTAPEGPILVVNLIKFKPGEAGRAAYRRYQAEARRGPNLSTVIQSGPAFADVCDGEEIWDHVTITRYERFDDFAATVTSPHYQGPAASHRPDAIERTIMLVVPDGISAPK